MHKQHPCKDCGKPCGIRGIRCRSCNTIYLWECGKLSSHFMPTGDKHPGWKGGRYKKDGYWFKMCPDHPRANKSGHVREHVLIWEEAHGKSLPNGWVIHHLNGIKDDNRPQNLIALPDMKHKHVFEAKAKRIQELEALLNGQSQLL